MKDEQFEILVSLINETNEKIQMTKEELQEEIKQTKEELQEEIKQTKEELQEEMKQTKEELQEEIKQTKKELQEEIMETRLSLFHETNEIKEIIKSNKATNERQHRTLDSTLEDRYATLRTDVDRIEGDVKILHTLSKQNTEEHKKYDKMIVKNGIK